VQAAIEAARKKMRGMREDVAVETIQNAARGVSWAGGQGWKASLGAGPWSHEMGRWNAVSKSIADAGIKTH